MQEKYHGGFVATMASEVSATMYSAGFACKHMSHDDMRAHIQLMTSLLNYPTGGSPAGLPLCRTESTLAFQSTFIISATKDPSSSAALSIAACAGSSVSWADCFAGRPLSSIAALADCGSGLVGLICKLIVINCDHACLDTQLLV